MSDVSAIIRAMGAVPDIRINEDGTSMKMSDKSLLQKARPETTPDDRLKEALEKNALVADVAEQRSITSAYRQVMGMSQPDAINEDEKKPTSNFIEVGHVPNEDDYFNRIIDRLKRR